MSKKLFIGSLSWDTNDDSLKAFFESVGPVASAKVITDRDSGRSKGFGFVEYESDDDGTKAIEQLNDSELDGRKIVVNEARPREERPRRDSGQRNSW